MSTRLRRSAALVATAVLGLAAGPLPVSASGFAIFEQGARSMGFAGAFTAQASDPSAIFFNAAGIAFLKGNQLHLGATLISPQSDFTGAAPFPGAGVLETGDAGLSVPPVADFTHQFSERLVLGVGLHVPFGLKTSWQNAERYSGRFISKRAKLKGFSVNPTVAYKLADRFAVGAGVDVRFASVHLERNIPSINPFTLQVVDIASVVLDSSTKTGVGFNLGVLAKPSDALSVGVSYRHKVKVDFAGEADFTRIPTGNSQLDALASLALPAGATPVETKIEFPSMASAGLAYSWKDWMLEGDVDWYQWSSFDSLPLTFPEQPSLSGVIPEGYENTWQFRVGLERTLTDAWTVRGGYFHDKSPTPAASVGPLLPDADRNGVAVGASWKRGQFRVDAAYWHLFFKSRSTDGLNRDNYNGIYDNRADLLAVSIGYGF